MKKIQRIAKNEKVIVQMLPEYLQEAFDKFKDKIDDAGRAHEELIESANSEQVAREFFFARKEADVAGMNFWEKVHTKYGMWNYHLGVRDGYCLVKISMKGKIKQLRNFLNELDDDEGQKGFQVEE